VFVVASGATPLPPLVWSFSVMLANVMKTNSVCPFGQANVPGSAGEALRVTVPVTLPLRTGKVPLPEAGGPGIEILFEALGWFCPLLTQKYVVVIVAALAVTTSESPTFPSPDSLKSTLRTAVKLDGRADVPLSAAALDPSEPSAAAAVVDVLNVAELVILLNLPTVASATPAAKSTANRQTIKTVLRRRPQNNDPSPFRFVPLK
jgi:hypothetical protein